MMAATVMKIITALAAPTPIWSRPNVCRYMKVAGSWVELPGPPGSERDDKVEAFNGLMQQDHADRQEGWRQQGQYDAPVDLDQPRAVQARGLDHFVVDPSQTSEEQRHDKSGRLPNSRNDQRVNGVGRIHEPIEAKSVPAQQT